MLMRKADVKLESEYGVANDEESEVVPGQEDYVDDGVAMTQRGPAGKRDRIGQTAT